MPYYLTVKEDGHKTLDEVPFDDFASALEHVSPDYAPRSSRSVLTWDSEVINGVLARCYTSLDRPEVLPRGTPSLERCYERAMQSDAAFRYDRSYFFLVETELGRAERRKYQSSPSPASPKGGCDEIIHGEPNSYYLTVLADGAPLLSREPFDDFARAVGFLSRYYRPKSGRSVLSFATEVIGGRFARAHAAMDRPEALDPPHPEFPALYPRAVKYDNAFAYDRSYEFLVESPFGITERQVRTH